MKYRKNMFDALKKIHKYEVDKFENGAEFIIEKFYDGHKHNF